MSSREGGGGRRRRRAPTSCVPAAKRIRLTQQPPSPFPPPAAAEDIIDDYVFFEQTVQVKDEAALLLLLCARGEVLTSRLVWWKSLALSTYLSAGHARPYGILQRSIMVEGFGLKSFLPYESSVLSDCFNSYGWNIIVGRNWIGVPAWKYKKAVHVMSSCQKELIFMSPDLLTHGSCCADHKGYNLSIQIADLFALKGDHPFVKNVMPIKSCPPIAGLILMPFGRPVWHVCGALIEMVNFVSDAVIEMDFVHGVDPYTIIRCNICKSDSPCLIEGAEVLKALDIPTVCQVSNSNGCFCDNFPSRQYNLHGSKDVTARRSMDTFQSMVYKRMRMPHGCLSSIRPLPLSHGEACSGKDLAEIHAILKSGDSYKNDVEKSNEFVLSWAEDSMILERKAVEYASGDGPSYAATYTQVFVKFPRKTLSMQLDLSKDVIYLKEEIEKRTQVDVSPFYYTHGLDVLEEKIQLSQYGIQKDSHIHMRCRLRGGKKKYLTLFQFFEEHKSELTRTVTLPDGSTEVDFTEIGHLIYSSWIHCFTATFVAGKTWHGIFDLTFFKVIKRRVMILKRPGEGLNRVALRNDVTKLISFIKSMFALNLKYPSYVLHLLNMLEELDVDILSQEDQFIFDNHASMFPSMNLVSVVYHVKRKYDGWHAAEKNRFVTALDKCKLPKYWLKTLQHTPIFCDVISKAKNNNHRYEETGSGAFFLSRNFNTHAPENAWIRFNKRQYQVFECNSGLDLMIPKYLKDHLADVLALLVKENFDIRDVLRAFCCLPCCMHYSSSESSSSGDSSKKRKRSSSSSSGDSTKRTTRCQNAGRNQKRMKKNWV